MKVYHYTLADRLIKILMSGYLKLTPKDPYVGELKAVWFTQREFWDKTAFMGIPNDILDSAGRVRITVSTDDETLFDYPDVKIDGNISDSLETSALNYGVDPCDWVVSFKTVPTSSFKNIEFWIGGEWQKIECLKDIYEQKSL